MGRKWRRPSGLPPNGPLAASSLLNGSIETRFVALPSDRPVWRQRRRYYKTGKALIARHQINNPKTQHTAATKITTPVRKSVAMGGCAVSCGFRYLSPHRPHFNPRIFRHPQTGHDIRRPMATSYSFSQFDTRPFCPHCADIADHPFYKPRTPLLLTRTRYSTCAIYASPARIGR